MTYAIGDTVFAETSAGSSPDQIAMFSIATEDPNPIHTDPDFAKASGFPGIIQQGPMTTAHFARRLAAAVGRDALRSLDVTFTAPVFAFENLTLTGVVTAVEPDLVIAVTAAKADGTVTARGVAVAGAPR
jgi:acyl dehydratase